MQTKNGVVYPFQEVTQEDVEKILPFTQKSDYVFFNTDQLGELVVEKGIAPTYDTHPKETLFVLYSNKENRNQNYFDFMIKVANSHTNQNIAFWELYFRRTEECPVEIPEVTGKNISDLIDQAEECFIDVVSFRLPDQQYLDLLLQESNEHSTELLELLFEDNPEKDVKKFDSEEAIMTYLDISEEYGYAFLAKTMNNSSGAQLNFWQKYYCAHNALPW